MTYDPSLPTQAAEYRALATLIQAISCHFQALPDEAFVAHVRSEPFRFVLQTLKEEGSGALPQGAALMDSFIEETATVPTQDLSRMLGVDRTRLYRGVTPVYSPPYPAEAVWRKMEDRRAAQLFEELNRIYRSQGMEMTRDAMERPDYLGTQLEFLGRLADCAAEASARNDGVSVSALDEALTSFAQNHLRWLPAFIEEAAPRAETDFYRGHLLMLSGLRSLLTGEES